MASYLHGVLPFELTVDIFSRINPCCYVDLGIYDPIFKSLYHDNIRFWRELYKINISEIIPDDISYATRGEIKSLKILYMHIMIAYYDFVEKQKYDDGLFYMCNNGSEKLSSIFFDLGANPNSHHNRGLTVDTPFHVAVEKGHINVVQMLLDRGVSIESPLIAKWTPLMSASYYGDMKILNFLLDKKANINARSPEGDTALSIAIYERKNEIIKLLLDSKVDINQRTRKRRTALMLASHTGQLLIVKYLCSLHADPFLKDDLGYTAKELTGVKDIKEFLREYEKLF